jgi:hypothetical protein
LIDARDFIDDRRPDKRLIWVEMLLDGRKPTRKPDAFTSSCCRVSRRRRNWIDVSPTSTVVDPATTIARRWPTFFGR